MHTELGPLQKAVAKAYATKASKQAEQLVRARAQEAILEPQVDEPGATAQHTAQGPASQSLFGPTEQESQNPAAENLDSEPLIARASALSKPAGNASPKEPRLDQEPAPEEEVTAAEPPPPAVAGHAEVRSEAPSEQTEAATYAEISATAAPAAITATPTFDTTTPSPKPAEKAKQRPPTGGDAFAMLLNASSKAEIVGAGPDASGTRQSAPLPTHAKKDDVTREKSRDHRNPGKEETLVSQNGASASIGAVEPEDQPRSQQPRSLRSWFTPKKDPNPPPPPTELPE